LATRANWKGFLKVAEVTIPVALYAAASSSARIALHIVNRSTGHRVARRYVDAETGRTVPQEQQAKGYEVAKDEYVTLTSDEIAAAEPEGDKTLEVVAFVAKDDLDALYLERPYYLAAASPAAAETFSLLCVGLRRAKVAAVARAVLFRRARSVLIRPYGQGLTAHTLKFDYQVRSAAAAFERVPAAESSPEALDLAKHIIGAKRGAFDPAAFHDRYEAALAELVKAKIEGRPLPAPRRPQPVQRQDLLAALRESAGALPPAAPPRAKVRRPRRVAAKPATRRKAS